MDKRLEALREWEEVSRGIDYTEVGLQPVDFEDLSGPLDEVIARLQGWKEKYEAEGIYDIEMKVEAHMQKNSVSVTADLSGKRKMVIK